MHMIDPSLAGQLELNSTAREDVETQNHKHAPNPISGQKLCAPLQALIYIAEQGS